MNRAVDVILRGVLGAAAGGIAAAGLHWSWGWVHSPHCTSREVRFCDIETDVVLPFLAVVWAIVAGLLLAAALVLLERRRADPAYRFGCLYLSVLVVLFAVIAKGSSPAGASVLLVVVFALAGLQTGVKWSWERAA